MTELGNNKQKKSEINEKQITNINKIMNSKKTKKKNTKSNFPFFLRFDVIAHFHTFPLQFGFEWVCGRVGGLGFKLV